MKKGLTYFITLLSLWGGITYAQQPVWKEITKEQAAKDLQKAVSWFNNENYSLNITHTSYKDYTTMVPFETEKGYAKRDKNNYHSFITGIHTMQDAKYRIVTDTMRRYIMLANASDLLFDVADIQQLTAKLDLCSSLKILSTATGNRYKMEYEPSSSIQRMEIEISKDGLLKEMVYYMNKEIKNEDRDTYSHIHPRLVITFSNHKTNVKFPPAEFLQNTYITWNGSKAAPTGKYSKYEFFDSRVNK